MKPKTRAYWKRYNRKRYAVARALAVMALGGKCRRCGDESGPFEFHHLNGDGGDEWSALPSFTRYKIVVQMPPEERHATFELLCFDCHVPLAPHGTRRRKHR